jgi:hypothetical protein
VLSPAMLATTIDQDDRKMHSQSAVFGPAI